VSTVNPATEALARVYVAAGQRITQGLLNATVGGWEWQRCQTLLAQIEVELSRLGVFVDSWEQAQLAMAWELGSRDAVKQIAALPEHARDALQATDATWATLNTETLQALATEAAGQRGRFLTGILRQSRDYLRRLTSGELAKGLGIGDAPAAIGRAIRDGSIKQAMSGRALQEIAGGVNRAVGVVYSDGSVHSLHAYGQMAARTGLMAAHSEGGLNTYTAAGVHLVQVSSHSTLCYLCEPLEGTVWALDEAGEALGYQRPGFHLPRHPNCGHSFAPWMPEIHGEGMKLDPGVAQMNTRELYARMRDDVPDGQEKMQALRDGFRDWKQYRRLRAQGKEHGPRWREAGIERRRLQATRMVLESGGKLTYPQAMARLTGQRMKAEGRGIFALKQ
jgi:hypothetical protein